ncbi:hypothetical protein Taro_042573 [Colocasia esculenta]|uniref:Uncharacterized protein n=1 Tax=Colocasia esculenta TaxID=4460 RepID=A0A843WIS5_COLES|nr:hypothetical protein [Colocasia esculenta]
MPPPPTGAAPSPPPHTGARLQQPRPSAKVAARRGLRLLTGVRVRKVSGPPLTLVLGQLPLLAKYGPDVFDILPKQYGPICRWLSAGSFYHVVVLFTYQSTQCSLEQSSNSEGSVLLLVPGRQFWSQFLLLVRPLLMLLLAKLPLLPVGDSPSLRRSTYLASLFCSSCKHIGHPSLKCKKVAVPANQRYDGPGLPPPAASHGKSSNGSGLGQTKKQMWRPVTICVMGSKPTSHQKDQISIGGTASITAQPLLDEMPTQQPPLDAGTDFPPVALWQSAPVAPPFPKKDVPVFAPSTQTDPLLAAPYDRAIGHVAAPLLQELQSICEQGTLLDCLELKSRNFRGFIWSISSTLGEDGDNKNHLSLATSELWCLLVGLPLSLRGWWSMLLFMLQLYSKALQAPGMCMVLISYFLWKQRRNQEAEIIHI